MRKIADFLKAGLKVGVFKAVNFFVLALIYIYLYGTFAFWLYRLFICVKVDKNVLKCCTKVLYYLFSRLQVTILFADLHAFLDNMKSTWELLENRVMYYEHVIKALLTAFNVPIEKLHFVRGTSYELTR